MTTAVRFRHSGWSGVSWQASYQRVHTQRTFANGVLGVGFQPAAVSFSDIFGDIHTADVRAYMSPRSWINVSFGYEFEQERFHDVQDNNLPAPRRIQTETRISQNAHAAIRVRAVRAGGSAPAVVDFGTGAGLQRVDARVDGGRHHEPVRWRRSRRAAARAHRRLFCGVFRPGVGDETARPQRATHFARPRCTSGMAADSPPIRSPVGCCSPRSATRGSSPTATRR